VDRVADRTALVQVSRRYRQGVAVLHAQGRGIHDDLRLLGCLVQRVVRVDFDLPHPNIVSPTTGEEEAAPGLGYTFPTNEENLRCWKRWWRVANQEQFFPFYVIGLLALLALSVLAFSTLGIQKNVSTDLAFIHDEGNLLADVIAPGFATFFFAATSIKSSRPTSAFWIG
jgi:hypothetical protein